MSHFRAFSWFCLLAATVPALASCTPAGTSQDLKATLEPLVTQVSAQATRIGELESFISYLATRVPRLPPTTVIPPVPTPFVLGSVVIEDGRCCLTAAAGQQISIRVAFQAISPAAEVTQMRVRVGPTPFSQADFSDSEWEPFTSTQTHHFVPPLNWSRFYVTVQYLDALGNLSAAYSDDMSVEGIPGVSPTP